jgi:hypothetical protein
MNKQTTIVITSINPPNRAMQMFAEGARDRGANFIVIGDTKSPADFSLDGADYYSVDQQIAAFSEFATLCPTRHYARKNVGYLIAMKQGAEVIIDTDDDNLPYDSFWEGRELRQEARSYGQAGWLNVYKLYSKENIWPRGLPLDEVLTATPELSDLPVEELDAPIQQGLANENPDVDAVYRLVLPLPQNFEESEALALKPGAWCPFNSQNTTWFRQAFPLLYLPAYCSFRMTDIWRSFVAQRIAAVNGWPILFHKATVWQERNEHNLMRDFEDEVPGYLHNAAIREMLEALPLQSGEAAITENMRACYKKLVDAELIGAEELPLLEAWLAAF